MKITVKSALDLMVASRLAEQIAPLNRLLTRTQGVRTEVRSLAFESATMSSATDPERSAYFWELTVNAQTFHNGILGEFTCEITPSDATPVSEYLTAALSWLYTMDEVEPALGQEFGFHAPWIAIEEL